ncbi:hypothetical protein Tco_0838588 [Tanacetum coccineum]|uniref:Uncharacterized protein n=1 Tax=Tanacetum coccineum TaxID=301880 RepID=A0ABQ5AS39_9ASTR
MASSACSSTQNPPKKAPKEVTYIDLTSNEVSPQQHHATIDTTLALTIPPPMPNMVKPFASPLDLRALELLKEARELKPLDAHIGHASKFAERIQKLLVVSYIDASGSKPKGDTKNDKIQRPSHRSKKNKVEAQPRKSKPSSNKNNHVSNYNANIKNVALSKNPENVCLSCNECLFSANHDA